MKSKRKKRWFPKEKRSQSRPNNVADSNTQKGRLLERVVAALYTSPGLSVKTNVRYPTTDGTRTREIDIVLTANVEGLPVEYVFQCKNESSPIGINKLGEFVGALNDIGVPSKYGIFVSVSNFTKDALGYAQKFGIRALVLKGLSSDRLKSKLKEAIQYNIFQILRVENYSVINGCREPEYEEQFALFFDTNKKAIGTVPDLIFNRWRNGEIPVEFGTHEIELDCPKGWHQFYQNNQIEPQRISAKVSVIAFVISIDGIAENHLLYDAQTQAVEKANTEMRFSVPEKDGVVPLRIISSKEELDKLVGPSDKWRLSITTPLPRIILNRGHYYPLSKDIAERLFDEMRKYRDRPSDFPHTEIAEEIDRLNENDLLRAGVVSLAGVETPVICRNLDGELVDVKQLYRNHEYDQILALKDRYFARPFEPFGDLICWSHVEKGNYLIKMAKIADSTSRSTRLLEDAKFHAESALSLKPNFPAAYELIAIVSFNKGDYDKAVSAYLTTLKFEPKNVEILFDLSSTYAKNKEWLRAKETIDKAIELQVDQYGDSQTYAHTFLLSFIINFELRDYDLAAKHIVEAWKSDPDLVSNRLAFQQSIEELSEKCPSIDMILILIEALLSRSVEFIRRGQNENATHIGNYAIEILQSLTVVDAPRPEFIASSKLDHEKLEDFVTRVLRRFDTVDQDHVTLPIIYEINKWYEKTLIQP